MENKAQIGAGDVVINLGGTEVTLKPTLQAALTLSSGKGLMPLVRLCQDYDIETITNVIVAGTGKRSKDMSELIFRSGMIELAPKCIRFLHSLANGGQAPEVAKEEDTEVPLVQE